MSGHYVLIGQTPVAEPDLLTWATWFEMADRRVLRTSLPWCCVSTVFLAMDHGLFRHTDPRRPVLFETMVFWEGEGGNEQDRCSTWREAEAMHARMVAEVSKPGPILASLLRLIRSTIREARDEWRELWNDQLGRPLTEAGRYSQ